MKFKANKPTMAQSRSGTAFRVITKFCWWPVEADNGDTIWLGNATFRQKATFTMFGNSTKWMTMSIVECQ